MADLVITAANVVPGAGAVTEAGTAGGAITAGQPVYRDSTTKNWLLADNNSATAAARSPRGLALNSGAIGQPVSIIRSGPVTIGATLVKGTSYYLSDTAGGISPFADLASGENVVLLGIATSTTVLNVVIVDKAITL